MTEREGRGRMAEEFFENLWQRGDPWELDSSEYELARYGRLLGLLEGQHYPRVLEIGCGVGSFTRLLARLADQVVALDVSPTAIRRARALAIEPAIVDFRHANIMEYDLEGEGPWDLIVISETICYLGWLYSFFDVGWFVRQLFASTREGGRCLLANAFGEIGDMLLLPWLIRTYRDLFLNVGYRREREEIFEGTKHGVSIKVQASLLIKPAGSTSGEA
jgi:SAM-dependent methyltransferase